MKRKLLSILCIIAVVITLFTGCTDLFAGLTDPPDNPDLPDAPPISLDSIPEFDGTTQVVKINGNIPFFTDEKTDSSYEIFSELDSLGRCGVALACIGVDLMPTESRDEIGHVKPSGWHSVQYDVVPGKNLYNRCHLIGFQLTGENDNEKNLITGTRDMNNEGMLPYENMIADYVKETGNHVLYRVTPIYEGTDLVAHGVLMEAKSVEDDEICFCIYVYNAQAGVVIDYKTGESRLADDPLSGVLNDNHDDADVLPAAAPDSVTEIYAETVNDEFSGCLIIASATVGAEKITLAIDISETGSVLLVTEIGGNELNSLSSYLASFNGATLDTVDAVALISHDAAETIKTSVKDALEAFKCYTDAEQNGEVFVANKNSKKFHKESCTGAQNMNSENKLVYVGYAEDLLEAGYEACGTCKPANKD